MAHPSEVKHHLNKPDRLKLSNYERQWLKVKVYFLPILQNNVHVIIYLTVFINFCSRSSTSSINSSCMKARKANLTLPSKMSRSTQGHH